MLNSSKHASRRTGLWLALGAVLFVVGWRVWVMAGQRHLLAVAGEVGSIPQFRERLFASGDGSSLIFYTETERGLGTYFCETAIDSCISNVLLVTQRQRAVVDERPQQAWTMLEAAGMVARQARQLEGVFRRVIGQGIGLEPTPTVFHWVQFGRVWGERLEVKASPASGESADEPRTMGLEPIPNHDHRPSNLAGQLPEKSRDPTAFHGESRVQPETQAHAPTARTHGQGRDHRDFLVVPCALHQHRPLPAGTPSASQQR
jgi:hypothetical protein